MGAAQARYQVFRGGSLTSWDALFSQASAFASEVGPRRVISISHSEDQNQGVVTVWYWDHGGPETEADDGIHPPLPEDLEQ
jgi:hypothetical protein